MIRETMSSMLAARVRKEARKAVEEARQKGGATFKKTGGAVVRLVRRGSGGQVKMPLKFTNSQKKSGCVLSYAILVPEQ